MYESVDDDASLEPRQLAAAARSAAARSYLLRWRPAIASSFFVLTAGLTIAFPDDARASVVMAIGLFAVASWLALGAVVAGASVPLVALVLTIVDVPLMAGWAIAAHSSTGEGMSGLAAVVLIAAWLLGPRIALGVGALSAGAVLATWFLHEQWADHMVLPDVLWIIVAATVLSASIAHDRDRALTDVGRTARRSVSAMRDVVQLRRRLVADVSHELRTPLTAINGFLDTVLSGELDLDDATTRDMLVEARRGGERLERLVTQLLVMERADTGELQVDVAPVLAAQVIGAAVRSVPVPADRSVAVTFVGEDARDAIVLVDPDRTAEMLANLVSNAIHHGRGEVELACTLLGPMYCIDVHDEGSGLVPGSEQHAFEPFATFGAHLGSAGLGLATSRAYALAQGGSLHYVDDDGTGAHSFRLMLPVGGGD